MKKILLTIGLSVCTVGLVFCQKGIPRAEAHDELAIPFEENTLPDDSFHQFPGNIAAVTKVDVVRGARKYIDLDHLAIVILGDRKTMEGPLRATGIAPIVVLDEIGEITAN